MGNREQWGRHCVYFHAIWPVVVILGPELRLPDLSDRWMWGLHTRDSDLVTHRLNWLAANRSEMLLGQTVFSPRQIPVLWQPAIITSLLVVTQLLTLGEKEKYIYIFFPFLKKYQWDESFLSLRSQYAKLKVPQSKVWASWLTATFVNHMLLIKTDLVNTNKAQKAEQINILCKMLRWAAPTFKRLVLRTDVVYSEILIQDFTVILLFQHHKIKPSRVLLRQPHLSVLSDWISSE